MRNTGAIHKLAQEAMHSIAWRLKSEHTMPVYYTETSFIESFLIALQQPDIDFSQHCWLTFTNASVARIRRILRNKVFKSDVYVKGEVLRVTAMGKYYNGDLVTVEESRLITHHGFLANEIRVEGTWYIAHHPSNNSVQQAIDTARDTRNWPEFFRLSELFSEVENANVMTVHKSQGRTIDYVWVDLANIRRRVRLLYVAYSRARLQLSVNCYLQHHGLAHMRKELTDLRKQILAESNSC